MYFLEPEHARLDFSRVPIGFYRLLIDAFNCCLLRLFQFDFPSSFRKSSLLSSRRTLPGIFSQPVAELTKKHFRFTTTSRRTMNVFNELVSKLSEKQLLYLESETREDALCSGLIKKSRSIKNDSICELLPITLFPTPFPREKYQLAIDVQQEVNLIMHRVAYDQNFLMQSLAPIIKIDDFTNNLYSIYEQVLKSGRAQDKSLGLFRSDYMLDDRTQRLLQIEVNAISVSFAGLTPNLTELHKTNLSKCGMAYNKLNFPDKNTSLELARGLLIGLEAYGNSCSNVLVVIEEDVINLSDQKHIEFSVKKLNPKVNMIRRTFGQLENELRLSEDRLLFVGACEIGVVYFRHAYSPEDYTEANIGLRTKIELSKAIKCPSIQHHLAGVKKIQQILTDKDVLRKFCSDNASFEKVHSTFAGIWPLSLDEQGDQAYRMALDNPSQYVLKPQR